MLAIWVKVKIKPSMREQFLKAIEADALASERDEPGCLRFNVLQDEKDENVYYFYEVYTDQAALDAHRKTRHYATWRDVADVLEGPRAAAYTADAIRRLGGTRWQWLRRLLPPVSLPELGRGCAGCSTCSDCGPPSPSGAGRCSPPPPPTGTRSP